MLRDRAHPDNPAAAEPAPRQATRRRWRLRAFLIVIGLGVALGLGAYLHQLETSLLASARAQSLIDAATPPRPIADVTQAVRTLKLITVEIDTKVNVEKFDPSWRGDVSVSLNAPVRLSYGTDLSHMKVDSMAFSPLMGLRGGYIIRIPRPTRIATEVFNEAAAPLVRTGWLRLRSRAGEYYLSQARKDVGDEARDLRLLPEDAEKVESATREQVAKLVKSIVGNDLDVTVLFEKETP